MLFVTELTYFVTKTSQFSCNEHPTVLVIDTIVDSELAHRTSPIIS